MATNLVESPQGFEYFLEENLLADSGDLGEALVDTAIMLKLMARNNQESGKTIGAGICGLCQGSRKRVKS